MSLDARLARVLDSVDQDHPGLVRGCSEVRCGCGAVALSGGLWGEQGGGGPCGGEGVECLWLRPRAGGLMGLEPEVADGRGEGSGEWSLHS